MTVEINEQHKTNWITRQAIISDDNKSFAVRTLAINSRVMVNGFTTPDFLNLLSS